MDSYARYMEDDEPATRAFAHSVNRVRYSRAGELFSSAHPPVQKRGTNGAIEQHSYRHLADSNHNNSLADFMSPYGQEKRLPSPFEADRYTDPRKSASSAAAMEGAHPRGPHFSLPLSPLNATRMTNHNHERTLGGVSAVGNAKGGGRNNYFLNEIHRQEQQQQQQQQQQPSSRAALGASTSQAAALVKVVANSPYNFPYDFSSIPLGTKKAGALRRRADATENKSGGGVDTNARTTTSSGAKGGASDVNDLADATDRGLAADSHYGLGEVNNVAPLSAGAGGAWSEEVTICNNNGPHVASKSFGSAGPSSAEAALARLKNITATTSRRGGEGAERENHKEDSFSGGSGQKSRKPFEHLNTTPSVVGHNASVGGDNSNGKMTSRPPHPSKEPNVVSNRSAATNTTRNFHVKSTVAEKAPFATHFVKSNVSYESLQPTEAAELMDRYGYHYEGGQLAKKRAAELEATVYAERKRKEEQYARSLLEQIDEKKRLEALAKDDENWEDAKTARTLVGIGSDAQRRLIKSREQRKALEEEWLREAAAKKERDAAERELLKPWEENWNLLEEARQRELENLSEHERKKREEEIRLENWKLEQERRAEELRLIEEERRRIEELTLSENVANYADRIVLAEEQKRAEQRRYKEELDKQIREKHLRNRMLASEQYELECRLGSY